MPNPVERETSRDAPRPADGEAAALLAAVDAFRRGEREAGFAVVFRHFRPRIERILQTRVYSPEERLDLTQAIFLRIYQGLEGFRGDGSFEGWVLQIAWNVYRKWRDRQPGGAHASPEVAVDPARLPEPEAGAAGGGGGPSALSGIVERERLAALRAAVAELPPQQRRCMELRVYQERSVREIAVALRLSPETVKVHLFQARQRLREALHDLFADVEF